MISWFHGLKTEFSSNGLDENIPITSSFITGIGEFRINP
jgi:hypothetical protein